MTDATEATKPPSVAPERMAGHVFAEGANGRYCVTCNRRWVEVMGATPEALDQPHWAHIGNLNVGELGEVVAEQDRIWELVKEASR